MRSCLVLVLILSACEARSEQHAGPDAAVAHDPLKQPTATATLLPVIGAEPSVSATALFVATSSGVDIDAIMRGCAGAAEKPLRILEAGSCDGVSAESPTWGGARGAGVPGFLCTSASSGEGLMRYSRPADHAQRWTIGDGSAPDDVVGHALVLLDSITQRPSACGVIERTADRTLVAVPIGDQAPSLETQGVLAGLCLTRLMAGAGNSDCIDSAAAAACATEHCELGACVQQCTGFTACLDASPDPCAAVFTCQPSAECAACQGALQSCGFGFCGAQVTCPALPRPDGPCANFMACCSLQGEGAASCLEIARLITSLGGEASCINGLSDWDVVSHMHVPCDTEAAYTTALAHVGDDVRPMDGAPCMAQADCAGDALCVGASRTATLSSPGLCQPRAPTPQLADHLVGTACAGNEACGAGECALQTALLTDYPEGYCTARCYDDASCGAGGVCILPVGSSDPGHCLQSCASDADCARGGYRCTPLGDGLRVVPVCYPRQPALPDHVAGLPCQRNAECASAQASCMEGLTLSFVTGIVPAPGGYCSAPCMFDVDCGAGAQCISGGISGGQCMASCDDQAPCREGYRCVAHLRDADPAQMVCMPIWDNPRPVDAGL